MTAEKRKNRCTQRDRQEQQLPDLLEVARRVIIAANTAVMVHAGVARGPQGADGVGNKRSRGSDCRDASQFEMMRERLQGEQ